MCKNPIVHFSAKPAEVKEEEIKADDSHEEVMQKLMGRIEAEKEKIKDEDMTELFKEYSCLGDYTDSVRGIEYKKGEVVQVLDTEKDTEWLVRGRDDHEKVRDQMLN